MNKDTAIDIITDIIQTVRKEEPAHMKTFKIKLDTQTSNAIDNICKMGGINSATFFNLALDNYLNLLSQTYMDQLKKLEEATREKEKDSAP